MSIFAYILILVLVLPVGTASYYRTLVLIGEKITKGWLRTVLIFITYLVGITFILGNMLGAVLVGKSSDEAFTIAFGSFVLSFVGSACFAYKQYKPRLDAVGINFR